MAGTPPASSSSLQADSPKDKCPSPFRLHLPATEQSLPDGDLFVKVYEHVAGLMKIEKHKEADEMDSSPSIAALAGIAEDSWKPFDVIWTARLFREMLYHTIASGEGGPLWLRETLRVKYAKDMCMTLMPHVWKPLLDQAKDYINIFVDPQTPCRARLIDRLSSRDINMLKELWSKESGTLSIDTIEKKFFPKVSKTQRFTRSSLSRVTGKTYVHSIKVLEGLDHGDYTELFDCLAKRAMDQTPLPPPVNWDVLSKLVRGVGVLTKSVLHHIIFWFEGHHLPGDLLQDPSRSWSDLLGVGPFATRASLSGAFLLHADQSPDEAAQLFVQALFDQIRDSLEYEWDNEAAKRLASQPPKEFFRDVRFLSEGLQQGCYRDRFQIPAWRKVLDLVKSYLGFQFQGVMELYNETSPVTMGQLQISLQSAIERSTGVAKLHSMRLPFLANTEVIRDLTCEVEIFMAMYLYHRCKTLAFNNRQARSSGQTPAGDENANQEQGQEIQMILAETARILRDAGYNPQPELQDERLDHFCLQRLGNLLAEFNNHNGTHVHEIANPLESNIAVPSNDDENLQEVLASASLDSEREQDPQPPSKKRRRNRHS